MTDNIDETDDADVDAGLAVANGTGPRTEAELSAALLALLRRAHRNGVTVEGGYDVRNGNDMPDWGVEVTRVTKTEE